jgi:hypothetical protein
MIVDEIRYRLTETLRFYNKEIHDEDMEFWLAALIDDSTTPMMVAKAFAEYRKIGKFAPKPRDIIEQMEKDKGVYKKHPQLEVRDEPRCDERIAKAWVEYMREAHDYKIPDRNPDVQLSRDEWLTIVNQEARKHLETFKHQLDDEIRNNGVTREEANARFKVEKYSVLNEKYWINQSH